MACLDCANIFGGERRADPTPEFVEQDDFETAPSPAHSQQSFGDTKLNHGDVPVYSLPLKPIQFTRNEVVMIVMKVAFLAFVEQVRVSQFTCTGYRQLQKSRYCFVVTPNPSLYCGRGTFGWDERPFYPKQSVERRAWTRSTTLLCHVRLENWCVADSDDEEEKALISIKDRVPKEISIDLPNLSTLFRPCRKVYELKKPLPSERLREHLHRTCYWVGREGMRTQGDTEGMFRRGSLLLDTWWPSVMAIRRERRLHGEEGCDKDLLSTS